MNKIFNSRNIAIAVITLAIGTFAVFGMAKVFFSSSTTVTGNVVSFMLNPEGKVDGAILDTGDQVHFGAETGEVVTANLQIGSPLTATGHAETNSDYGREFHAKTLQIGDQTITIAGKPKGAKDGKLHPPKGPREPKDGDRPMPPNGGKPAPIDGETPLPPNAENAPAANAAKPETATVSGSVQFVLVNKEGKPRGIILANGEQLNLGKEVEDAGLSFDQNTNVSAEGEIAKSQFGTFVRPNILTIGSQTFTFNR